MIGAGGTARAWIRRFLPVHAHRVEIVALVDIAPEPLAEQGDFLGLPANRRFARMEDAFEAVDADCCAIVIPPAAHRRAVELAAARGLDILSEKPLADSWEDSVAIYRAAKAAGVKMQVMQNYRANPPIRTLKQVLESGRLGRSYYIVSRFAADYRRRNAWGATFRHEMRHAILVEGSIHHFDQIRNLSGADCATIAGWEWNPGAPSFDGASRDTTTNRPPWQPWRTASARSTPRWSPTWIGAEPNWKTWKPRRRRCGRSETPPSCTRLRRKPRLPQPASAENKPSKTAR